MTPNIVIVKIASANVKALRLLLNLIREKKKLENDFINEGNFIKWVYLYILYLLS